MAGRGRSALTSPARASGQPEAKARARGHAGEGRPRRAPPVHPRPLLYTAQDLARFCEVDLKTIHHWADGGKIAHHRTEGRHLRFRRNHVVAFLRRHGYPLHAELAAARPTVFFALGGAASSAGGAEDAPQNEIVKKLAPRFAVRRFDNALAAIAHLVAGEPDVLVAALDDPTWSGPRAARALKAAAATSWIALVVVTADANDAGASAAREAGADLVLEASELPRVGGELTRMLGVE
ncbi:MAG: helix-turn-helix domain-containing protein [Labilithrix sp.]|nr:helix-turn-helix domain-containing protein [Labilithrix sp.]MCW5836254.1 helix-turn-helix domain-containing protein [Labilithrix sp.]